MMFLHLEKENTLNEFQVMGRFEGGLGYKAGHFIWIYILSILIAQILTSP